MEYDVLKSKSKSGSISLSRAWLTKHLDLQPGELVLQKTEEKNGKKVVTLTKFDPRKVNGDNLASNESTAEDVPCENNQPEAESNKQELEGD